jgi:ketosteroid isomerase-like protein
MASDLSPDQKAELARAGLENWIAGDREAAIGTFTDDIEVFVPADLGNAGHYRGVDGFRSWNQEWEEVWDEFEMTLGTVEPVGRNHVVAHMDNRGTGTASGIEVQNSLGWVLEVNDEGRMAYLSLQRDLDAAREHAREREGLA